MGHTSDPGAHNPLELDTPNPAFCRALGRRVCAVGTCLVSHGSRSAVRKVRRGGASNIRYSKHPPSRTSALARGCFFDKDETSFCLLCCRFPITPSGQYSARQSTSSIAIGLYSFQHSHCEQRAPGGSALALVRPFRTPFIRSFTSLLRCKRSARNPAKLGRRMRNFTDHIVAFCPNLRTISGNCKPGCGHSSLRAIS